MLSDPPGLAETMCKEREDGFRAVLDGGTRELQDVLVLFADLEQQIVELSEQAFAAMDRLCQELPEQGQRHRNDAQTNRERTGRTTLGSRDVTQAGLARLVELETALRSRLRDHREAHARALAFHAAAASRMLTGNRTSEATDVPRASRALRDASDRIAGGERRICAIEDKIAIKNADLLARFSAAQRASEDPSNALGGKQHELESEIRRLSEEVAKGRQEHARLEDLLRAQLRQRETELAEVYASKSWKLTHPLRVANLWLTSGRRPSGRAERGFGNLPRWLARKALVSVLNRLRRNPTLHARVVHRLESFPLLLAHARAFARVNRPAATLRGGNRGLEADFRTRRASKPGRLRAGEQRGNRIDWADRAGEPRAVMIFVDHTLACPVNTGVQRVVRQFTRALIELNERPIPVKWDSVGRRLVRASLQDLEHLAQWNGPIFDRDSFSGVEDPQHSDIEESYLRAIRCAWLIVPEVTHINFHGRDTTMDVIRAANRLGLKTGFVFHDAIPLRRKEFASLVGIHSEYMRNLLLADVVWPVSRWAGTDLVSFWSSSEFAEMDTMPVVDTVLESGEVPGVGRVVPIRGQSECQSAAVILSVGTIEARKNQLTLIRAFERIRQRRPDLAWELILVGNLHPLVADEVRSAVADDAAIAHLGHVCDDELAALYQQCAFTVFPSVEEGFGLPILESLWFGKPCVCANFGAMSEVAKDGGCMTIDTRSVQIVADAIESLIDAPDRLRSLAAAASSRALPTWNDYARQILASIGFESSAAAHLGTVYFWVDHTIGFYKNTGIQRVTRNLARSLMESGASVCPVKWNAANSAFVTLSQGELEYLHRWNGPAPGLWSPWCDPSESPRGSWFLMPELPLHYSRAGHAEILRSARTAGLHTAAIFYDAIPWKMVDIYPGHFTNAHGEYMEDLNEYDLVLPISDFSREDLVCHLGSRVRKLTGMDERIRAVALAGEFLESARVVDVVPADRDQVVILCVGTVEPRKNHIRLLDAFERAVARSKADATLIIVGRSTEADLAAAVRDRMDRNRRIQWNDDADDRSLADLYRECDFTVFPSVEEGFGLPILESLWNGKPCICADFGAMSEVAAGGGCVAVDVRDEIALADAIAGLIGDKARRKALTEEAVKRRFKTWREYAEEIAGLMSTRAGVARRGWSDLSPSRESIAEMGLGTRRRPLLSVCISTFDRPAWLATNLANWARLQPAPHPDVELVVCDNASTDDTRKIVMPYEGRTDLAYKRNEVNVGRLGNLSTAVQWANGRFIWVIGDHDLPMPGSLETILDVIRVDSSLPLIYLNHACTSVDDARKLGDFQTFFRDVVPVVPPAENRFDEIRSLCAVSPSVFAATGALVFRRDHALRAFSQNTHGRPFSTMLTSVPAAHYVLHNLMLDRGCWIGAPQIVVNTSPSWSTYAPLMALERMPEVFDVAEYQGGEASEIDRWRRYWLGSVERFFGEVYADDEFGGAEDFCPRRLVWRFNHLEEFGPIAERLAGIYRDACARKHPAASLPPAKVFPRVCA